MKSKNVLTCLIVISMALFFFCGTNLAVAAKKSEQISDAKKEALIKEKPEIYVQIGHANDIASIAVSPDKKYILSGSADMSIRLWDFQSGRLVKVIMGHTADVLFVSFLPDGKHIISASSDKTIRLWDLHTGQEVRRYTHNQQLGCAALSKDGKFLIAGDGKNLKLYDLSRNKDVAISTFIGNSHDVVSAAFSPDGKYIVSGSLDASNRIGLKDKSNVTLNIWEISSLRIIKSLGHKLGDVFHVEYSSNGKSLLTFSTNNGSQLWDVATGKELQLRKREKNEQAYSLSTDGKYYLVASHNQLKDLDIREVSSGKVIKTMKGHYGQIAKALFLADGKTAISGCGNYSWDKSLILWDINKGEIIRKYEGNTVQVSSIAFSPTEKKIFSGTFDGSIIAWDLEQAKKANIFKKHDNKVSALSISPDGQLILSGGWDNKIKLWEITSGNDLFKYEDKNYVLSLSSSKDGKYFMSGAGFNAKLWDTSTLNKIRQFGDGELVTYTSFVEDDKYILIGGGDWIEKRERKTGEQIFAYKYATRGNNSTIQAQVSNNNQRILIGESQGDIEIISNKTGKLIKKIQAHPEELTSASYSKDNSNILTTSRWDNNFKIWDAVTGNLLNKVDGHLEGIVSARYSDSGKYILTGSNDGTTRLWSTESNKEIAQFINFANGEWIIITSEGYYNSSLNGHKHLNVRQGLRVYGIDQFYDVFYRPDIVMAKLRGDDIKPLITLTIDDAIKNPPPEVDFTSVPSGSTTPKVKVCYQAKNTGGGIGEVRLFHNGKLIQSDGFYKDVAKTAGKIQLASLDSKSIREDMRSIAIKSKVDFSPIASKAKGDIVKDCVVVDAVPGENEVSVSAFNKGNTVQSYMKTASFKAKIKAEDSHLYMLIVGTDQYNDQSVNLKYAVKDARDIKDKLISQSKTLYKTQNIHAVILTDNEATKTNIQNQISLLAQKIKPADGFVLFVAGHGVLLQNQYFMLTHDFDGTISNNSMISSNEIVEASKQIKSLSQLFIFDTCHAGGVDYIVSGLYDARMSVLAKKMGLHIYASANDKQTAMDGYKGNGLFTYTLLDGLNNNKEAGKNDDGNVSVVGLGSYSKKITSDISKEIGHSQTPLIINFGKDYPLYKLQ